MPTDEQVGRNVARFRADMTQEQLAEEMRSRGFRWSQNTVWKVEKGERPLRFTEAKAVAEITGMHVEDLARGELDAWIDLSVRRAHRAEIRLDEAAAEWEEARVQLLGIQMQLAEMGEHIPAVDDLVLQTFEEKLRQFAVESAASDAAEAAREDVRRRFMEDGDGSPADTPE